MRMCTPEDIRPGIKFGWRRSRHWVQHKMKVVIAYEPDTAANGGTVRYRVDGSTGQLQKCCGLYFVENAVAEDNS